MRKDDTPRPRLSLYASVTEPSAEPSKAIEFVRYELDGLEGWPETQSRPEVFVDDWLRPPSRINLTRFVDGFNVSLGKKVEPRLTDAAHRTWLEQYWRDSDKSRVNKGPATALFGLGAWILAAGVYLFWTTFSHHVADGRAIRLVGGALLIGLGLLLFVWATRISGPTPGDRRWESDESSTPPNATPPSPPP